MPRVLATVVFTPSPSQVCPAHTGLRASAHTTPYAKNSTASQSCHDPSEVATPISFGRHQGNTVFGRKREGSTRSHVWKLCLYNLLTVFIRLYLFRVALWAGENRRGTEASPALLECSSVSPGCSQHRACLGRVAELMFRPHIVLLEFLPCPVPSFLGSAPASQKT